jgi:hypothetical protein
VSKFKNPLAKIALAIASGVLLGIAINQEFLCATVMYYGGEYRH